MSSTHPKSCTRAGNADPFLAEARLGSAATALVWLGICLGLVGSGAAVVVIALLHAAGAL